MNREPAAAASGCGPPPALLTVAVSRPRSNEAVCGLDSSNLAGPSSTTVAPESQAISTSPEASSSRVRAITGSPTCGGRAGENQRAFLMPTIEPQVIDDVARGAGCQN